MVLGVIIAFASGYVMMRAIYRWSATLRILGVRKTLAGAKRMWRLRWRGAIGHLSSTDEIPLWPIHPSVPLGFELSLVAFTLLAVWMGDGGTAHVRALLTDGALVGCIGAWVAARSSESILPPTMLYLGVSEPGQYEMVSYFAGSRAWLVVSAIDHGDPSVNQFEIPSRTLSSLILGTLKNWMPGRPIPLARRRLESIRTSDGRWEDIVQALLGFVPIVVIDLRSHSAIVERELAWALQVGAPLVAVTLPDGRSSVDVCLAKLQIPLSAVCADACSGDDLPILIAARIDRIGEAPPRELSDFPARQAANQQLANLLLAESSVKRDLVERLAGSTGPDADLDRAISQWAGYCDDSSRVPGLTASIPAALTFIRQRVPTLSWTLSVASDGKRSTAWAELALQPIPRSYRLSASSLDRPIDTAAKALLMALLNAELGVASGFGDWRPRSMAARTFSPMPAAQRDAIAQQIPGLLKANPFLSAALTTDGWCDVAVEEYLARRFHMPPGFGVGGDEARSFGELQLALESLCGERSFRPVGGPYSMVVEIGTDGRGRCEVAQRATDGGGWLVALSYAPGQSVYTKPALALLIAALKAEHGVFDGYRR
jgi:hypothetical protein